MKPTLLATMLTILVISLATFVGCGRSGPKLVPVSGTVTVAGKPAANVAVFFIGPDKKTVGVGRTDAEGRFRLENGALPGINHVYFSVSAATEVDPAELAVVEATGQISSARTPSIIPAKYTDPTNPQLTFDVPPRGTSAANFDLSP